MLFSPRQLNFDDGPPSIAGESRLRITATTGEAPLGYAQTLGCVRRALRQGAIAEAEHHLMRAAAIGEGDAAFHNLLGIVHECHGRVRQARKCYGRAVAASAAYWPAQVNLRRLYELNTFGRTDKAAAIGDDAG